MLCILAFSSLSDVWYPKGCCISTRYHPLNMPWKDGGVYIVKVWCMWFIRMCGLSCIFPTSPGKVVCFTIIQFVLDVRFGYVGSINRFWWLEITLQWFKVSWFVFPFGLRQAKSERKCIFPATQVGRRIAMSRGIYMGGGFIYIYIYLYINIYVHIMSMFTDPVELIFFKWVETTN